MKKLLFVSIAALFAASFASAQSLTPTAHELGVGASVSSSTSTVRLFYNVTKSFVIEPLVGIQYSNQAVTIGGGTATNYPDTWASFGLGVYYVALRMDRLAVLVGPSGQFVYEKLTGTGTNFTAGDTVKHTYWNGQLNVQLLGMITKNLGLFATVGGYYASNSYNDTTANYQTVTSTFGIQSVSVGASYFFK